MSINAICFALMIGGAVLSCAAILGLRLKREMIISGLVIGLVIAALNMLVEYLGVRFDLYHVSGPWVLLVTPLPLTIAWVGMTFIYLTGYSLVKRRARTRWGVPGYMAAGIIIGWLTDYMFYRADILSLGANGSPFMIMTVWLVFVPVTVFLFEVFMGILSGEKDVT